MDELVLGLLRVATLIKPSSRGGTYVRVSKGGVPLRRWFKLVVFIDDQLVPSGMVRKDQAGRYSAGSGRLSGCAWSRVSMREHGVNRDEAPCLEFIFRQEPCDLLAPLGYVTKSWVEDRGRNGFVCVSALTKTPGGVIRPKFCRFEQPATRPEVESFQSARANRQAEDKIRAEELARLRSLEEAKAALERDEQDREALERAAAMEDARSAAWLQEKYRLEWWISPEGEYIPGPVDGALSLGLEYRQEKMGSFDKYWVPRYLSSMYSGQETDAQRLMVSQLTRLFPGTRAIPPW
jgi:hypothetical protein